MWLLLVDDSCRHLSIYANRHRLIQRVLLTDMCVIQFALRRQLGQSEQVLLTRVCDILGR